MQAYLAYRHKEAIFPSLEMDENNRNMNGRRRLFLMMKRKTCVLNQYIQNVFLEHLVLCLEAMDRTQVTKILEWCHYRRYIVLDAVFWAKGVRNVVQWIEQASLQEDGIWCSFIGAEIKPGDPGLLADTDIIVYKKTKDIRLNWKGLVYALFSDL